MRWVASFLLCVCAAGCGAPRSPECRLSRRPPAPPVATARSIELSPDGGEAPVVFHLEPLAVRLRNAIGDPVPRTHVPEVGRLQIHHAGEDEIVGATTEGTLEAQLFGRRRWRRRKLGQQRWLETELEDGATTLRLRVGCAEGGPIQRSCQARVVDDWRARVAIVWIPDRELLARFQIGAAYRVETDRGGIAVHVVPIARRLGAGGFSIGVAISYADFGPDQRATISLAAEYDLSMLWRRSISSDPNASGRNRGVQLGLGAELGVALELAETDFGHGIAFAFALDPYLELRMLPADFVAIPVRFFVPITIGDTVTSGVALTSGVAIPW